MKKLRIVIPVAVIAVTLVAIVLPTSSAKYIGRQDYQVTVHAPAVYLTPTTITLTPGYYYIEAWGGNGGNGRGGREGGTSQKISGLYYVSANSTLMMYVGTAGASTSATGGGAQPVGGTNGSPYGNGGAGGNGGTGGGSDGGKGGAGGAGTFVFLNGTALPSNLLLVSGGGGGGGGSASAVFGSYNPGLGGNGGTANTPGANGANGGGNQGGTGATGNSPDPNGNGVGGNSGTNGSGLYASGAGGGGGGGGYATGGAGGGGGGRSQGFDVAGGGGGGKGGASYLTGVAANPGFALPNNGRPTTNGNGAVIITFLGL